MKSTRRHELQQNTLDTELAWVAGFFRRHGTKLAYGLLAIAILALGFLLWTRRVEKKQAEVQGQYDRLLARLRQPHAKQDELLGELHSLGEQDTIPWIAADATLTLARLYAARVLSAATPESRQEALQRARTTYRRVIDTFPEAPAPVAAARVGLGKLAEDQGDFAAARRYYQSVLDLPGLAGYPVRTLARQALNHLAAMGPPARLATTLPAWREEKNNAQAATQPAAAPAAR